MNSDAQFSIRTILKPYAGFEAVYQGQPVTAAINLSPGGVALDEQAGQPGYDPRLPRGMSVPMGARVILWLPVLFAAVSPGVTEPYIYTIGWRLRNLADFIAKRKPYHQPSTASGVPNTFVLPEERFPLPVAVAGITYNQTEPAGNTTTVIQHHRTERIEVYGSATELFINPDGGLTGPQQGVEPATGAPPATPGEMRPRWVVYDTFAYGDELILGVNRGVASGGAANWEFAAGEDDNPFSDFFGAGLAAEGGPFDELGVYVFVGKSP